MEATCQRCAHTHTHAGDCGHTHDQQGTGFLILSFLLLVGGVILRYLQLPFWMIPGVEVLWFLLAFLPVGFPVMVEVWKSIRQKDIFNEFSLMLLATIGALGIGEYPEGVADAFLFGGRESTTSCSRPGQKEYQAFIGCPS